MDISSTLRKSVIFRELDERDIEEIAKISAVKKLVKGENLFYEGSSSVGFFFVVTGKIKVFKISLSGREQILHIISPFETFAEASMFSGGSFPANAEAMEDSALLFFAKEPFMKLIEKRPRLAVGIIASFSKLLRQFNVLVEELSLKEVPERLARYIIGLPVCKVLDNGNVVKELPISRAHLAAHLGTITETLSRALKKLKQKEIIDVKLNTITISKQDELENLARGSKL